MPDTIHNPFRLTLRGTGAPPPSLERFGPSTLVEVGAEVHLRRRVRRHAAAASARHSILRYHRDVFNAPSFRSRGRVSRSLADGLDRPAVG